MPHSPTTSLYNQSVLHHLLYVTFRTLSPKDFCHTLAAFLDEYMPVSLLEIKKYENAVITKIASYSIHNQIFHTPDKLELSEKLVHELCSDPYIAQYKSSSKILRSSSLSPAGKIYSLIYQEDLSCIYFPLLLNDPASSLYIAISTMGSERYTSEHTDFLDSIRLPLSAALTVSLQLDTAEHTTLSTLLPWRETETKLGQASTQEPSSDPTSIMTLTEMTKTHILNALKLTNGRVSGPKGAAVPLGIPASTLASQIRRLGIKGIRKKKTS